MNDETWSTIAETLSDVCVYLCDRLEGSTGADGDLSEQAALLKNLQMAVKTAQEVPEAYAEEDEQEEDEELPSYEELERLAREGDG